ncbi:MAG: YggT family protein [Candidatus Hydrogenedentes bacterium]|nr:YggT family protein [Candidatus Hydrogenedentota bacterium]
MIESIIYSVSTLYMLMILVRWLSPFLELNMHDVRLRWISHLVDPPIGSVRRILPNLGPMDFGPVATLFIVWIAREVALAFVTGGGLRAAGG